MGFMIIGMTLLVAMIHFPMWGSMFVGPKAGATEEEYYCRDYSKAEQEQGLHHAMLNFASESRSQRGFKQVIADGSSPKSKVVDDDVSV